MFDPLKNLQKDSFALNSLFGITEHSEAPGSVAMCHCADFHSVAIGYRTALQPAVSTNGLIELCTRPQGFSDGKQTKAERDVGGKSGGRIHGIGHAVLKLLREGRRGHVIGPRPVEQPCLPEHRGQRGLVANLTAQFDGPRRYSSDLIGTIALRHHQNGGQGTMQVQIKARFFSDLQRTSEQTYPGLEMTDGLFDGKAQRRLLAGLQPVSHRGFGHSCRRRVMSKKLGRCRPEDFQRFDQFRVDGLAAGLQQIFVGRITHQRVFEDVERIWRGATPEDQLGTGQTVKRILQGRIVERRDRLEQPIIEIPTNAGRGLRNLFDRLQAVEPRH